MCTWEVFGGMCEGCGREFDESDRELDEDEQFFLPALDHSYEHDWHTILRRSFEDRIYAEPPDYDEDEYDTPAEFDADEYEGSFINDGEQEGGSLGWVFYVRYLEDVLSSTCSSTPGNETYEDAQSEHSQQSNYTDRPYRVRRQSIELTDEPSYPDLNIATEEWIGPSDSEDDNQGFLRGRRQSVELADGPSYQDLNIAVEDWIAPSDSEYDSQGFLRPLQQKFRRVISSDDEDEDLVHVGFLLLSCWRTVSLTIMHRAVMKTALALILIDICAHRQSLVVLCFVHQARAFNSS